LTISRAENDARAAVQVISHPGKHKLFFMVGKKIVDSSENKDIK
jgi:hypothetical protein